MFIVFEGIDGSGKTTQLKQLARWLPSSGLMPSGAQLHVTREPSNTPLGQSLRRLLLYPPPGAAPCPNAELLLYAADRAQHVETVIRPALAAGHWVLSDRFSGSTVAYQGHGRGLSSQVIADLDRIATGGLQPDLTLWLDLPIAESLRRRSDRPADRIEATGEEFLQRVGEGFAQLAQQPGWQRINANQSIANVATDCSSAVATRWAQMIELTPRLLSARKIVGDRVVLDWLEVSRQAVPIKFGVRGLGVRTVDLEDAWNCSPSTVSRRLAAINAAPPKAGLGRVERALGRHGWWRVLA